MILKGSIDRDGCYFGTGHDAVSYFYRAEVECVLEYLHLVLDVFIIGCFVDVALYEIVKVFPSESLLKLRLLHLLAHHPKQAFAERARELADGPQYNIKDVGWQREDAHHLVRVDTEKRFGKEFACNENDERGYNRLQEETEGFVRAVAVGMMYAKRNEYEDAYNLCHQDAVNDKRDVVADQKR